jgi:hypothetical protein
MGCCYKYVNDAVIIVSNIFITLKNADLHTSTSYSLQSHFIFLQLLALTKTQVHCSNNKRFTLQQAMKALDGGGRSTALPSLFISVKATQYTRYRRLGGSQGYLGQVQKISSPTGIQSPDLPACSQSLYTLHIKTMKALNM